MVKTLIRHGNSYALVIDKPILELLRIEPETPLEVSTNGDKIIISPVRKRAHREKLRRVLQEIDQQYGPAFQQLAE